MDYCSNCEYKDNCDDERKFDCPSFMGDMCVSALNDAGVRSLLAALSGSEHHLEDSESEFLEI